MFCFLAIFAATMKMHVLMTRMQSNAILEDDYKKAIFFYFQLKNVVKIGAECSSYKLITLVYEKLLTSCL